MDQQTDLIHSGLIAGASRLFEEGNTMSTQNLIVASLADTALAGKVLNDLHASGFDLHKWALIAQPNQHVSGPTEEVTRRTSLDDLGPGTYQCIPIERRPDYEEQLRDHHLLLIAQGSPEELDAAQRVIHHAHPCAWDGKLGAAVYYGCAK